MSCSCARAMIWRYPKIISAGVTAGPSPSALWPMSLMPMSTMRYRTPAWASASRSKRFSALGVEVSFTQQTIAVDSFIEHRQAIEIAPSLEPLREHVGPVVVRVRCRLDAIGDRIPECDNRIRALRGAYIHRRQKEPRLRRPGARQCGGRPKSPPGAM